MPCSDDNCTCQCDKDKLIEKLELEIAELKEELKDERNGNSGEYEEMEDELKELRSEVRRLENACTIVDVSCARCDRTFRSLESVKYCSEECELGATPMPNQGRKK